MQIGQMKKRNSHVESSLRHEVEKLRERAAKDALSGLLNRDTTEQCIKRRLSELGPDDTCALFIVDLDDFKRVNDMLGHRAGDQAIRQSGKYLSQLFREEDIVGRLGGDEFIVFLSGKVTERLVRKKGKEISQALQFVMGSNINLSASTGIYLAAGKGQHFEGMYQLADLALYKAKKSGKHRFCIKRSSGVVEESSETAQPVNTIPLSGLLEYMDSGVALLEMGETVELIYVSPSFCRNLGVDPPKYTMPRPLSQIVHPGDLSAFEQDLRQSLQDQRPVDRAYRISRDGENWAWWHIRAVEVPFESKLPVMLVTTTDISRYKENMLQLQETNRRLQTAFDQTPQGMWEVDVKSRVFHLYEGRQGEAPLPQTLTFQFPGELISEGWIHRDSAALFERFAQELMAGQGQGYGNFVVRSPDQGTYSWASFSYRMLFDDAGRPLRAVGIVENTPQDSADQNAMEFLQHPLPEALVPGLVLSLKADLTANCIHQLWLEGKDLGRQLEGAACDQLLQGEHAKLFLEEDRQSWSSLFQREELLARYEAGERWLSGEYRRVDGGGGVRWVRHIAHLAKEPETGHVYLFQYDICQDRQRQWEQQLPDGLQRIPDTTLYEKMSMGKLVEEWLDKNGGESAVFAMIRIQGLEYLLDGNEQHRVRAAIFQAIPAALGCGCFVGRYSRSQLAVFFPEASSNGELRKRLEEAIAFVRLGLGDSIPGGALRFVTAVVRASSVGGSYQEMTFQAGRLCKLWHGVTSDTVALLEEEDGLVLQQLRQGEQREQIISQGELQHPLTEEEKNVMFQCVTAMLGSASLEQSVRQVLSQVGKYYQADRVYLLTLQGEDETLEMPYQWTNSKKSSSGSVAGMKLSRIPVLRHCYKAREPVCLTRNRSAVSERKDREQEPWRFVVHPLMQEGTFLGFFCLENPREHASHMALLSQLMPYLLQERLRFSGKLGGPGVGMLDNMENLLSYTEVVYSLNSDRYQSLGAVSVDIPNLSALNSSKGFAYGSQVLWYVAKALTEVFGSSLLFRTWDAEFVAFCPNVSEQVFDSRCSRLIAAIRRRYPREVRIGSAWSEGSFVGKELTEKARAAMRNIPVDSVPTVEPSKSVVEDLIKLGRFTLYLQPQIDVRTGGLVRAEALVRGMDENGKLIPPDKFIHAMEKAGSVRELDLFMLDKSLALMNDWQEKGLGVVPLAVNFSRVTLFDPSALRTLLELQSRYPHLPHGALELEITESAGSVDLDQLQQVMERFRELGVSFALDDFGSQYSNLALFANVRFDTVKLDRSLITRLVGNPIIRTLVKDLVDICQTYGRNCVAEGVETKDQVDSLLEMGCHCIQGFFYDKPMPAEKFEEKYLRTASDSNR